jgi:hypothetical protein
MGGVSSAFPHDSACMKKAEKIKGDKRIKLKILICEHIEGKVWRAQELLQTSLALRSLVK